MTFPPAIDYRQLLMRVSKFDVVANLIGHVCRFSPTPLHEQTLESNSGLIGLVGRMR